MTEKKNTDQGKPLSKSAQRRQREREQRYQTILNAAEELFAKDGYQQASMEKIADAAEVSVGAVYFYFKNKEDLLIQILEEIGFRLRKVLGSEFKKTGESLDGFKNAGQMFFEEFCTKYPEKVAIIFRESMGKSQVVEERRREIFDKLTGDVLSALMRLSENLGHSFKSGFSAEVMAVSIMGIYERVAYKYLFWRESEEDMKTIGRDAVDFIIGGINNMFNGEACI